MKHKVLTKFLLFGALCTILLSLTGCPQKKTIENIKLEDIKIVFDEEKMACWKDEGDKWNKITSGTAVPEGTKLRFYSRKLPDHQIPDKWTFGNKTITAALQADITVDKSYADKEKTINVAYTLRNVIKLKIVFDIAKLKVEKKEGNTFTTINNGEMIDERVIVRFSAINIPSDKIVYGWTLNGTPANFYKYNTTIKKVIISKDYADLTNTMNIDYNLKTPEQITINYDNSKMYCDYYDSSTASWTRINPGETFPEGKKVWFNLKEVEEGKVPVWTINGKTEKSDFFEYVSYFLDIDKIGSGKYVQVGLSYRGGKTFTVKFDSSKIKCTKEKDGSTITSGTQLIEGTEINFKTTDGTNVKWIIGNYIYNERNSIDYIVFEADADADIIEVSYE
ncbi:hypothetical protein [Treponema denticola]|uniref:Uncharacterized protein n=1 Tax=Treponema denticola SP33 TaxID=999437 RepID=M2B951_TREDN|nr:hypothetical protein [Treponema denticola]EMB25910.1 hypothetical protein HMPREF9733_01042 [Treponema denticola SP33]EPF36830.1 hypothetical protein HMPREF9732_00856 [Treponema denticola SP32]